jgi:parallel beta-helix repeat protein
MPQPSRHASAWESVWEWIQENAWLVSLILLFTLFLIARPFVSELIWPTVIELSPEDSQETIIKAFERIRAGGTIRLESGSYYIDADIVIEKPIKLVGVSGSVSFGTYHKSLVFRAKGDSQVQNISFQNTAIRVEKGAVAISRCNFTAGGANYSAIKATNATSVRVEGCVIRGYHRGIFADGNAVLKAYNNICESHKQSGISLFGSAQGEVSGNTCRNNGYHGIVANEQSRLVAINNRCHNNKIHGIAASQQSRLVARNNTCEGNKQDGIGLFGSAQGEVSGNACRNNGIHGIAAEQQSRLVAKNNTCEGNKDSGISLFGSAQGEVEGNICRNNSYHGIAAEQQSRLVAKNNTCEGNKDSGISLFGSAQGEVEGNICRSNGSYGIYANNQSRLVARNNTCEGSKKYSGIALFGSAQGEVSGNTCRNNGLHGIAAHEQSRLVARNNTCEGNKSCGIFLYGRMTGTLENNICGYNLYGIYALRTIRAYVGYNECYNNTQGNLLLNQ